MSATYPTRFDAVQPLSPTQERSLLTALGLGLVVTVLALGWAAVVSRVEHTPTSVTPKGDTSALLSVDRASTQWVPEDTSL